MRRTSKQRVPAWVLPLALMLVAGSAFALLRGTGESPSISAFAQRATSQAATGRTTHQARAARGASQVLPAPQGWSPGQQK